MWGGKQFEHEGLVCLYNQYLLRVHFIFHYYILLHSPVKDSELYTIHHKT